MKLSEALTIILDLARDEADNHSNPKFQEAIDMVEEHQEEVEVSEGPIVITQTYILDVPEGMNITGPGVVQEDD